MSYRIDADKLYLNNIKKSDILEAINIGITDWEMTGLVEFKKTNGRADICFRTESLDDKNIFGIWDGHNIVINNKKKWRSLKLLRSVLRHEIAHALGCEHTYNKNDLMFPFFDSPYPEKFITSKDIEQLKNIIRKRRSILL